jgi:hypothetical protein
MSDSINPTPHLNRARVKQTALEIAGDIHHSFTGGKHPKFTRVGMTFLERIEAATRQAIRREVAQHPTRGKTLL